MSRILFICRMPEYSTSNTYTYGITGLFNSASFVAQALADQHECKVVKVEDENSIDKEMFEYKPDIVILEAVWVTPKKLKELMKFDRYKHIKWLVRVHSKPAFLANEGIALQRLIEYAQIPQMIISGNNHEFTQMMLAVGAPQVYLPNIYPIEFTNTTPAYDKPYVDIGCFGAIRPMKNHLNQALAAIRFSDMVNRPIRFHVNATRAEQGGENVLRNLRALFAYTQHELVEHPWYSHTEFLNVIQQMDVGMQVSMSESFNIVSADFVSRNVPIVTSSEVEFVFSTYHSNPSSIVSIANTLKFAFLQRVFYTCTVNQWLLNFHNNKATRIWTNFLGSLNG